MITFIIGGIKSGKSNFALKEAENLKSKNFYFIATAKSIDEEMQERIEKHKKQRGNQWITFEEPINLHIIVDKIPECSSLIIDCLTTWLTNLIVEGHDVDKFTEQFLDSLNSCKLKDNIRIFIVANEVGLGIIPDTKLGRKFVDIAGYVNQKIMELSDIAYLMVAGRAIRIK